MNRLLVVGAGGHGIVVAEAAELAGNWDSIAFLDDRYPRTESLDKWPIVGTIESASSFLTEYSSAFVALGDNRLRIKTLGHLRDLGFLLPDVCHPAATVSPRVETGGGTVFMPNSVVNARAKLGTGCIINTGATVDHDCILGDAVHIAPGAHLAASVTVGNNSWVGVGACVRDRIRIGHGVVVGGGAAVVANVASGLTVFGVPAKRMPH